MLNQSSASPTVEAFALAGGEYLVDAAVNESMVRDMVEETISAMSSGNTRLVRALLDGGSDFKGALYKLTVDLALVMSLAKTLEDEEDFEDSVGLLARTDFREVTGAIASFARTMVRRDQEAVGQTPEYLYELVDTQVVKARLDQLAQFVDSACASS